MKEEFTYGELVEVREEANQRWVKATFVQKVVDVRYWTQEPGEPACGWQQIRKIQPEPQPEQQTPEQDTNTYFYLHDRIQGLSRRIDKLESELKNLLK
jgi:hypothetical protein